MAASRFAIRIGRRSRPLLRLLFGVTPERAWVDINETWVTARFGWFTFHLPLESVVTWRIEGPWHWITAVGVRRSIRHGDVSFAGSPRGGVRMDLRTPVRWLIFDVPAFYVGVEDLDRFAVALAAHGIPGVDARTA